MRRMRAAAAVMRAMLLPDCLVREVPYLCRRLGSSSSCLPPLPRFTLFLEALRMLRVKRRAVAVCSMRKLRDGSPPYTPRDAAAAAPRCLLSRSSLACRRWRLL